MTIILIAFILSSFSASLKHGRRRLHAALGLSKITGVVRLLRAAPHAATALKKRSLRSCGGARACCLVRRITFPQRGHR